MSFELNVCRSSRSKNESDTRFSKSSSVFPLFIKLRSAVRFNGTLSPVFIFLANSSFLNKLACVQKKHKKIEKKREIKWFYRQKCEYSRRCYCALNWTYRREAKEREREQSLSPNNLCNINKITFIFYQLTRIQFGKNRRIVEKAKPEQKRVVLLLLLAAWSTVFI